jgi:DNA polymerase IIIc chi subunit
MEDKRVVFYLITGNPQDVFVKLCEKLYNTSTCRMLLLCQNEKEIKEIDTKLWTYSKLSFIPHGSRFSVPISDADYCRVWISDKIEYVNNPDHLLHNGAMITETDVLRFSTVIDIFDKTSDEQRTKALERAELYKIAMFNEQKIWIQGPAGWEKSDTL